MLINRLSLLKSNRIRFNKKIIIIAVLLAGFGGLFYLFAQPSILKSSQNNLSTTSLQNKPSTNIAAPLAKVDLNKEFSFPIKDSKGKEIGVLKYNIQSAELRNEIVVKGQKATAINGRIFLILNLKLVNEGNQKIQVNTRDFIRISVNNSPEWLAPDIHNDPVEAQAISTKITRLGLSIGDSDKNIKVQVGEINGKKEVFDLQF